MGRHALLPLLLLLLQQGVCVSSKAVVLASSTSACSSSSSKCSFRLFRSLLRPSFASSSSILQRHKQGSFLAPRSRSLPFGFQNVIGFGQSAADSSKNASDGARPAARRLLDLLGLGSSSKGSGGMEFESRAAAFLRHWVWSLPPISRTYILLCAALSAATTAAAAAASPVPPSFFYFDVKKIVQQKQVWRLLTPLIHAGELSLSAILALSFAYTYLPLLERQYCSSSDSTEGSGNKNTSSSRNEGRRRFCRLLLFGAGSTYALVAAGLLPAAQQQQSFFAFLLFLWSRVDPTGEAEVFGSIPCTNASLPLLLLLQHLLLEGQFIQADIWGAAAALAYLAIQPKP